MDKFDLIQAVRLYFRQIFYIMYFLRFREWNDQIQIHVSTLTLKYLIKTDFRSNLSLFETGSGAEPGLYLHVMQLNFYFLFWVPPIHLSRLYD